MVRSFSLRNAPEFDQLWRSFEASEPIEVEQVFKDAIKKHANNEFEEQDWIKSIVFPYHASAVLALLLVALPSLATLDLMLTFETEYLNMIMDKSVERDNAVPRSLPLSNLQQFMHAPSGKSPRWVGWALQLPSMRRVLGARLGSFQGGSFQKPDVSDKWLELSPRSSGVTHLEFRDSLLSVVDLQAILNAPKALRTFIYRICWDHTPARNADFHSIRTALNAQQDTLEDLWLDTEHKEKTESMYYRRCHGCHPIAPLTEFAALKRLKIPSIFLFGPEVQLNRASDDGEEDDDYHFDEYDDEQSQGGESSISSEDNEEAQSGEGKEVGDEMGTSLDKGCDNQDDPLLHGMEADLHDTTWTHDLKTPLPPFNDSTYRRLTDLFPPSLQSLWISRWEVHLRHTIRAIEDLLLRRQLSLQTSSPILPNLTELALVGPIYESYACSAEKFSHLVKFAATQGIRFRTFEDLYLPGMPLRRSKHLSYERRWGMDGEFCCIDRFHTPFYAPAPTEVSIPITLEQMEFWAALDREFMLDIDDDEDYMSEFEGDPDGYYWGPLDNQGRDYFGLRPDRGEDYEYTDSEDIWDSENEFDLGLLEGGNPAATSDEWVDTDEEDE
ncbi:hypothetical protein MMC10_006754 [Thelotrema lepadinum]|nr:hypothetical protein [Thelotrema lepadinum]